MGRRGYDVEALPNNQDKNDPMNDGGWMRGFVGQQWEGRLGTRNKAVDAAISQKMTDWGEGSRAIIYVKWKGYNAAHVFNAEMRGGKVIGFDAQTGRRFDLMHYLRDTEPSKTMISRVDHLSRPDESIISAAMKRRGT